MSRSRLVDRHVLAALALAVLLVGAACSDGEPGVGVSTITADVVFGLAEDGDDAPGPANLSPAPVTGQQAATDRLLPDQVFDESPSSRSRFDFSPRPSKPVSDPCPEAAQNEFPDVPVSSNVPVDPLRLPAEGLYRWQRSGTLASAETANTSIDVTGFEERLIRNVEIESEKEGEAVTFTYELVQPEIHTSNIVISTFRVQTDGRSARARPAVPVNEEDPDVAVHAPEAGLVLKRVRTETPDGEVVSAFNPAPNGLLLLPLEVVGGTRWSSTARDPLGGRQVTLEGRVRQPGRVDACGEMIEGWQVETTLTSSGGDATFSRDYSYMVAPQYGAILLQERIEQAGGTGDRNLTFTIGQQDPSPVLQEESAP